jgi:hypothetical protein
MEKKKKKRRRRRKRKKKRRKKKKLTTELYLVAEFKNAWDLTYTPPYTIIAWCVIKHRNIPLCVYSFLLKAFRC